MDKDRLIVDWLESYGVDHGVAHAYADSLRKHIACVQEAGVALGVPGHLLDIHDQSKWSAEEFPAYARHFKGNGDPQGFAYALIHHIHVNPHHWQHWIFPDGFVGNTIACEGGVLRMPDEFALEMIADWMVGKEDISTWLPKNMFKIRLHSETAEFVRETLEHLGYGKIVNARLFAHEVEN